METQANFVGPRLVLPHEQERSEWLSQGCFGSGLTKPPPPEQLQVTGDQPKRSNSATYAFFDGSLPVSQITINWEDLMVYGLPVKAGFIGGVCTHPDYRENRLAGRLLQFCTEQLREGGARIMIISGGRGLYRRAGSVDMGQFAALRLRPGVGLAEQSPYTVRTATPEDAPACSRLYFTEAAHFRRQPHKFHAFFQPEEIGFHAEKLVVTANGEVAAYLLLNTPWDFVGNQGAAVRCVFEYAGQKAALAHALRYGVEQLHLQELIAPIPWQDADLWSAFVRAEPSWEGLPEHTMRIIDFPGLMRDLRELQTAVLPSKLRRGLRFEQTGPLLASEGGDRQMIARGSDSLILDGAQMTRLVFGPPGEPLQQQIPGALREVVQGLFPLPAFFTGMDYH